MKKIAKTAKRKPSANPKKDKQLAGASNLEKDPSDWVSGGDPMTGAQASYLKTLAEQTGAEYEPALTKAQASERIDDLRHKAGLAE